MYTNLFLVQRWLRCLAAKLEGHRHLIFADTCNARYTAELELGPDIYTHITYTVYTHTFTVVVLEPMKPAIVGRLDPPKVCNVLPQCHVALDVQVQQFKSRVETCDALPSLVELPHLCMYACMYTCIYVSIQSRDVRCTDLSRRTPAPVCMHACMHVCVYPE